MRLISNEVCDILECIFAFDPTEDNESKALYFDIIQRDLRSANIKSISESYIEVYEELKRAKSKHPDFPTDMFHQLAIMQEEAGEVTKAVLQYHYENGSLKDVKEELIQTAAMCIRMVESLPDM